MAAENGDDGKKAAVFRGQRHGDLSVLLRCLIESAAQAVLFVSSQRKGGKPLKKRRGSGSTYPTHRRRVT